MRGLVLRRLIGATGLALMVAASTGAVPAAADTLKIVLASPIGTLDPITTTAYATRTFSYLVWDTLIARDADGNYRPQMLEKWDVSADGKEYTFTLRDGLQFTDGAPVTAQDAVSSIKRWWQADAFGKRLAAATGDLSATDDKTFVLKLSSPFSQVIEALGKPSSNVPVVMPARIADATPANTPITEFVGSGPFIFDASTWNPGSTLTVKKNSNYVPRDEEPSGYAGGKKVYFDAIEIVNVVDQTTQATSLQLGEIDFLESAPLDFLPILEADAGVQLAPGRTTLGVAMINHLTPPLDNVKHRRALQALMMPEQFMASLGLPKDMWVQDCTSMFICGTEYGSNASAVLPVASVENTKKLLAEAGYKGEPIRLLASTSNTEINNMGMVFYGLLQQAGLNVELFSADSPTILAKRWDKSRYEEGGWNLTQLIWDGGDLTNPFTNFTIANNCTDGFPGSACDERITAYLEAFQQELDPEKRKEIVRNLQTAAYENVQFLVQGQYSVPSAYRANLQDFQPQSPPVFWGMKRAAQ
jgi:peptide/nickel transport system substrate-binding protein